MSTTHRVKPIPEGPQFRVTIGLVPHGYEVTVTNNFTDLETTEAGDFCDTYEEYELVTKLEAALFTLMRTFEDDHLRPLV